MQWVILHLKSQLRREQMFGNKHRPLKGDIRYNASATFADQRIPQLKKAIEILENEVRPQDVVARQKKEVRPQNIAAINQLTIFK
jgi:hypothetical protein